MSKTLKATHGSPKTPLKLGEREIECYVLQDETRVLSGIGMQRAIALGEGSGHYFKRFISSGVLQPFIKKDLASALENPVRFTRPGRGGKPAVGYDATILPKICDMVLEARLQGALNTDKLQFVAQECELLTRALANIGIIALIDEVTGYQEQRRENELHEILQKYISPELLPWSKQFPEEYYKEIFRLKNWPYEPGSVKRPSVIGTWTNKWIYDLLPEGVLAELKKKTPKDGKGRRVHRYHQLLTIDMGNPHLEKQLVAVMTLFRASSNWRVFEGLAARSFGKQKQLEFNDDEPEA